MKTQQLTKPIKQHTMNSLRTIEFLTAAWAIVFIYLFAANTPTTAPFLPLSIGATGIFLGAYTTRTKIL